MKRRKVDIADHIEFGRAVSFIRGTITSITTTDEDLDVILEIQNDLLKLTLKRIHEKGRGVK